MSRSLPPGVEINPMPADFAWALLDDGKVIKAVVKIDDALFEVGLRPAREKAAMTAAAKDLTERVWQLLEFHRIGRTDLMAYADVNRHAGRKRPFAPLQLD